MFARSTDACAFSRNGNGFGGMPGAEQAYAVQFHRFTVAGVLGDRPGERLDGLGKLFALVEDDAAQPLHARRLRRLRSQLVEDRHCLVEPAPPGEVLGRFEGRSGSGIGGRRRGRLRILCATPANAAKDKNQCNGQHALHAG